MGVISIVTTINMLHGAYYRKPKLLRPFIYWELITVVFGIFFAILTIYAAMYASASTKEELMELPDVPHNLLETSFWVGFFSFYSAVNYYFGYVIVSRLYNQLLDGERVQLDNLQDTNRMVLYFNHQAFPQTENKQKSVSSLITIREFNDQTRWERSPTSVFISIIHVFKLPFIISVQLYLPRSNAKMLQLPKTTGTECFWGIPVHTGAFAIGISVAVLGTNDGLLLVREFVLGPRTAFLVFRILMCCIDVVAAGTLLRGLHKRQSILYEPFLVYEILLCILCMFLTATMLFLCFLISINNLPYVQVVDIPHNLRESLSMCILVTFIGMFCYYSYVVVKRSQNLLIEELKSSAQDEQLDEEQTGTDDLTKLV
ncbi:hypothetical protein M3Y94_00093600 [Aphelenchoides besseyi]|nr:hypothetical protein M3Y94_00093600 [Aphelenchoides besseyi]